MRKNKALQELRAPETDQFYRDATLESARLDAQRVITGQGPRVGSTTVKIIGALKKPELYDQDTEPSRDLEVKIGAQLRAEAYDSTQLDVKIHDGTKDTDLYPEKFESDPAIKRVS